MTFIFIFRLGIHYLELKRVFIIIFTNAGLMVVRSSHKQMERDQKREAMRNWFPNHRHRLRVKWKRFGRLIEVDGREQEQTARLRRRERDKVASYEISPTRQRSCNVSERRWTHECTNTSLRSKRVVTPSPFHRQKAWDWETEPALECWARKKPRLWEYYGICDTNLERRTAEAQGRCLFRSHFARIYFALSLQQQTTICHRYSWAGSETHFISFKRDWMDTMTFWS